MTIAHTWPGRIPVCARNVGGLCAISEEGLSVFLDYVGCENSLLHSIKDAKKEKKKKVAQFTLGMVVHPWNFSAQEAEVGGPPKF